MINCLKDLNLDLSLVEACIVDDNVYNTIEHKIYKILHKLAKYFPCLLNKYGVSEDVKKFNEIYKDGDFSIRIGTYPEHMFVEFRHKDKRIYVQEIWKENNVYTIGNNEVEEALSMFDYLTYDECVSLLSFLNKALEEVK